jgi:hypothetical protein
MRESKSIEELETEKERERQTERKRQQRAEVVHNIFFLQ